MITISLFIAFAGALACIVALLKQARHIYQLRLLRATGRSGELDIRQAVGPLPNERRLAQNREVVQDVLAIFPDHRYTETIASLSGRLVFEAWDRRRRLRVVMKTVSDPASARRAGHSLFNEAFVLSHLAGVRSPRLLEIATTPRQRPVVVREHLSGTSMDHVLLQRAARLSPPRYSEVRDILRQIAEAVEDIHEVGVIHGDLKPANILGEWVTRGDQVELRSERVSLLDFEAAIVIDRGIPAGIGGVSRGTPFFMAPERYVQNLLSEASDVYSLSAIASLLLTGRPQRPGSSAGERIKSGEVRNILRHGLNVDPTQRYRTISSLSADLTGSLDRMIATEGDNLVSWPLDSGEIRSEVSQEAMTVTLAPIRSGFSRVASRVDVATFDGVMQVQYSELDPQGQQLLEGLWFRGLPFEEAAADARLDVQAARRLVESFLFQVEESLRAVVLRSEQGRLP